MQFALRHDCRSVPLAAASCRYRPLVAMNGAECRRRVCSLTSFRLLASPLVGSGGGQDPQSDGDDVDEVVKGFEVIGIAGVQRELCGEGGCGDEQVDGSGSAGFAPGACDGCEDPAVGAGGVGIEGEWVEGGFGSLDPVLAAAAFGGVVSGVWAGSEFCEGD